MTATDPIGFDDAITVTEAAQLLGLDELTVSRLRRDGLLARAEGRPSYSLADVTEFVDNPWLSVDQAAILLKVNPARVDQLVVDGTIPSHLAASGRRVLRLDQVEVVASTWSLTLLPPVGSVTETT